MLLIDCKALVQSWVHWPIQHESFKPCLQYAFLPLFWSSHAKQTRNTFMSSECPRITSSRCPHIMWFQQHKSLSVLQCFLWCLRENETERRIIIIIIIIIRKIQNENDQNNDEIKQISQTTTNMQLNPGTSDGTPQLCTCQAMWKENREARGKCAHHLSNGCRMVWIFLPT